MKCFHSLFSLALLISCSYLYNCLQIVPPDGVAVLNNDYYYQCTMLLTSSDLPNLVKFPFTFISPSMHCNVTDWLYCHHQFPEDPSDEYCACTSKTGSQTLLYVFTMYKKKLPQSYNGQWVTCKLGGNYTVSRQTILHGITRKPGSRVSVCDGQNLTFNWGFGFTYDFTERYKVVEVSWKTPDYLLLKCININKNLYDCSRGADIGETDVGWVIPHQSANHDLPRLVYHNVQKAMRNTEVTICIVFELKPKEQAAEDIGINQDTIQLKKKRQTLEEYFSSTPWTTDSSSTLTSLTTLTRKPTTTVTSKRTTTTTTATTTTTPAPVDLQIGLKKQYMVSDSTIVDILEAPSEAMHLEFTGTKSLTGQVIVNCEINKASQLGEPPVNLTIWHNNKVIITREKTYLLRYMINIDKGNLTCNVVGESALCHGGSFLEDLKNVLDVKDIKAELEVEGTIDYHLLLYMCESLACLVLMMATVGLVIEHISSIMRRRKRLLELQLRELDVKKN